MPRPVRFHRSFLRDIAGNIRWLLTHRAPEERARLRAALASFNARIGAHPALGEEFERRGSRSYRVFPLGGSLPYLVWYYYDAAHEDGPVWLVMLMHEAQDRERFDPDRFEP